MKKIISKVGNNKILSFLITYVVILIVAKYGEYLYFEIGTAPAVLWPSSGIAITLIWLYGYRLALPTFLALLTASFTGPLAEVYPLVFVTPLAQVFAYVTGVFLLKLVNFDDSFSRFRDVLFFLATVGVISTIAPTVSTLISVYLDIITTGALNTWIYSWSGYFFSCIVGFPVLISWLKLPTTKVRRSWNEVVIIFILLALSMYLLYEGHSSTTEMFPAVALFFFAHFWICLRFSIQAVASSLYFTTLYVLAIVLISSVNTVPLNQQIFLFQLFMFLIVPVSLAVAVLVKERDRTIYDLQRAVDRIVQENITNNDFIAVLAHELRNPLAPIKTTLELLEHKSLEEESTKLIKRAGKNIDSMKRLLDDLLDIARVTQGKFKLRKECVNLCQLLQLVVESTKTILNERKHTITMNQTCDDNIWLDVDPVRFEQALVNILTNAAKYTDPGGVIEIDYKIQNKMIEITVSDNGQGIDKDYLEQIFTRFWQIKPHANTDPSSGIGIGLSLTKQIIEMHKGTVRAESLGQGQGSQFIISMPFSNKNASDKMTEEETTFVPADGQKILVVDDNKAAADSLSRLLSLKGYETAVSYTAIDAMVKVESFDPNIILLDLGLPDINGYELATRLRRSDFTNKQIIAVSGYGRPEDIKKAIESGFNHHFTKPMSIKSLENYLQKLT